MLLWRYSRRPSLRVVALISFVATMCLTLFQFHSFPSPAASAASASSMDSSLSSPPASENDQASNTVTDNGNQITHHPGPVSQVSESIPSSSSTSSASSSASLNYAVDHRIHTFYYSWYGNPTTDGKWIHWNHRVLVDQGKPYQPPQDLGSTFWPSLGPYSSHDDAVIEQHFEWMAAAKIGSVCVTWWGENTGDENGEDGMTDLILPRLLDAAAKFGMKISFHIEPYRGRNAASVRANLQYIYDKHADHPAFSPVFFVYDSYLTPPEEWATLLSPTHPTSIRHDTQLHSAVVLGLVVEHRHLDDLARASFDGVYTYFASNTFVYGSTPRNWPSIAEFTQRHHMKFVPCVGPGYDDEVIRPWNAVNTKPRRQGQYYDEMWEAALRTQPAMVGVTSWNEHHEGTSIEPCVPHTSATRKYLDYSQEGDEMYYVSRTAYWVDRFQHPQEQVEPET